MNLFTNFIKKTAHVASASVLVLSQALAYSAGFFISAPTLAGATTTSYSAATTAVSVGGAGWDVSTPSNMNNIDGVFTSESGGGTQGFSGFNLPVPAGATVDGIEIYAKALSSDAQGCRLGVSASIDGGTTFGPSLFFQLGDTAGDYTYGGPTNTVGLSPVADNFSVSTNFVVSLQDNDPGVDCENDAISSVDQVLVRVYFTEATKYDICHATNSATNPYNSLNVNESAIDGVGGSDHFGQHTGPIANTQEEAQEFKDNQQTWGDIIPPLPGTHSGLNWTADGQAILQNDCQVPEDDNPQNNPFVRVTFICKADYDGVALAWNGSSNEEVAVNDGDYIFRIRYESSSSNANAPATVPYATTQFVTNGDIDQDEVIFATTDTSVAGVKVTTTPDNLYNGTASTNEDQLCEQPEEEELPTVTVTKFVGYENGGDVLSNEFILKLNDEKLTPGQLTLFNNGNNATAFDAVEVPAGQQFIITEDEVPGYRLKNIACKVDGQNVGHPYTPSFGEQVACSVSNVDLPDPTVTVTKFLRNLNVGSAVASDFTISLNDEQLEQGELQEFNNGNSAVSHSAVSVEPGEKFVITETDVDGYELFYIQCFVDEVSVGYPYSPNYDEEVSCNVINRYTQGAITVTKEVSNQWGGTLGADNFTLLIKSLGGNVISSGAGSIEIMLAAGQYMIDEDQETGYVLAGFGGDCNEVGLLTVVAGEKVSCTLLNKDQPAKIRVHKNVVNDNGGDADAEDFEFTVNGEESQNFATEGNYVELEVSAGTYDIEEVDFGNEYTVDYDGCEGIDAEIGQTYNCYITNDDVAPKVIIRKFTDPCFTQQSFDFTIEQGDWDDEFELSSRCEYYPAVDSLDAIELPRQQFMYMTDESLQAGEVTITETETDNWFFDEAYCNSGDIISLSRISPGYGFYSQPIVTIDVKIGETVYCDFYNIEEAEVVVTKFHDLNNNGEFDSDEETLSNWEMNLSNSCSDYYGLRLLSEVLNEEVHECEENVLSQLTAVDGTTVFDELVPGQYTVSETLQDGWVQSALYCSYQIVDDSMNEYDATSRLLDVDDYDRINEDGSFYLEAGKTVHCYVGNYETPVTTTPTGGSGGGVVLGASTTTTMTSTTGNVSTPAVLAFTGSDSRYSIVIGLLILGFAFASQRKTIVGQQ